MDTRNGRQGLASTDGPPYPANWIIDDLQRPDAVLDRHRRNAMSPGAHEVFRKQLEEKTARYGVIHVDPATGYRARFQPQGGGDTRSSSGAGDAARREEGNGERGTGRGRQRDASGRFNAGSERSDRPGDRGNDAEQGSGTGGGADDSARHIADLERQLAEARAKGGGGQ